MFLIDVDNTGCNGAAKIRTPVARPPALSDSQATTDFDLQGIYSVIKSCQGRFKFVHHPIFLRIFRKLKSREYFVYIMGNEVLGFVAANKNFVGDLLVDGRHRHEGIGTKLRHYIEAYVLSKHLKMIITAPQKARDYYEQAGYKFVEALRFTKDVKMIKEVKNEMAYNTGAKSNQKAWRQAIE